MLLNQINLINFRNFKNLTIDFGPDVNVFYGANGIGKTSFLEAIYYAILGKSFRSSDSDNLINYEANSLQIILHFSDYENKKHLLGISKEKNKHSIIHLDSQNKKSHLEIARNLPIQIFTAKDYKFFESRDFRIQVFNYGLFHMEQQFAFYWKRLNLILKNRNQLLKEKAPYDLIKIWNDELVKVAENIDFLRQEYIKILTPYFVETVQKIFPDKNVSLRYYKGFSDNFDEELKTNWEKDKILATTTSGPHKADLEIISDNYNIKDTFSRGQQKVILYCLKIAQSLILKNKCLFLFDDITSELDENNCAKILNMVNNLNSQVFITAIAKSSIFPEIFAKREIIFFNTSSSI